jgi:hypothetical protein
MAGMLTQIMLGLMLFFSALTLLPRGVFHLRESRPVRGVIYLFLGLLSAFFGVISIQYAYLSFTLI